MPTVAGAPPGHGPRWGTKAIRMRDPDDSQTWDAFLKQAEANRAVPSAFLFHTQRMVGKVSGAVMEPDRLESWYFADGDAKDIASMANRQAS